MKDWTFVFFSIFLIFLIIFILFWISIPVYKKHKKITAGIINYDSFMRKFVYKICLSKDEIINLLITKNIIDDLLYEIDFEELKIKFSEYGSKREYYFYIQECDGFSILRLEQVDLIGDRSHIPYKINPFIVNKLQAEIVPYSQYGI